MQRRIGRRKAVPYFLDPVRLDAALGHFGERDLREAARGADTKPAVCP